MCLPSSIRCQICNVFYQSEAFKMSSFQQLLPHHDAVDDKYSLAFITVWKAKNRASATHRRLFTVFNCSRHWSCVSSICKFRYDVALWATVSDVSYSWSLWHHYASKFVEIPLVRTVLELEAIGVGFTALASCIAICQYMASTYLGCFKRLLCF